MEGTERDIKVDRVLRSSYPLGTSESFGKYTAGFIKIGPFYVDYPIGLSNSGWRGNFAELFSHPKIFVVIKK